MAGDSFKHFSENFIKKNIIAKFCNEAENNFPTNQFFFCKTIDFHKIAPMETFQFVC